MRTSLARPFLGLLLVVTACRSANEQLAGDKEGESVVDWPSSPSWVTHYEPSRSADGATLAFIAGRTPVLFDMNGEILHSWPEARVKSRLRLLEDCSLLAIALGRSIVQYDWSGNLIWEYPVEGGFPHHDVIRLDNGNTLVLVQPDGRHTDVLLEVDRDGNTLWEWDAAEALTSSSGAAQQTNPTHINSVQELPENPWFRAGDKRFRPGNLLLTARDLDLAVIVDRRTEQVVWSYSTDLDKPHEALMIPPGLPGHGNIQLFNNRFRSFYSDRQSVVLEIQPQTSTVVWQFRQPGFYSPTSGLEQPLPNGNVLIASSRGGRVFEVTRDGDTVWQWAPPFEPVRPHRYPWQHCPQLAELERHEPTPVAASPASRHIDTDAYRFARRGSRQDRLILGEQRSVLKSSRDCRQLLLPGRPRIGLAYGVDRGGSDSSDLPTAAVSFTVDLTTQTTAAAIALFSDTIPAGESDWRQASLEVADHAFETVELCVEVSSDSGFWAQPIVIDENRVTWQETERSVSDDLTPDELQVRRDHLRTLGYIN